jgi:two-component system sensor histidine kinase KdpD
MSDVFRSGAHWRSYLWSGAICAAVTLLTAPLHAVLDLANIVMVFLLAVVFVAVRYGRGPAVMAAFLSVGTFDFFYVPPRFTFSVHDAQYLLTFAVMLVVALVIGQLTASLKSQARVATLREERVTALYEMSRDLSAALTVEQVAEIGARFVKSEFDANSALMLADAQSRVQAPLVPPGSAFSVDLGMAQLAYQLAHTDNQHNDTLRLSPVVYVALKAPMRVRGVLAVESQNTARLHGAEQRRLLETCASLLAISLERIHYVDVAQSTMLQMESERLRNSLLAAISHDLRTPLTALVGMAESLPLLKPPPTGEQAEIIGAMRDAALRMNSLVANLLDMARLQAGPVPLNRQWQPLEEVVGSALQAMSGALDRGRVHVALPEDLPLLNIDAALIERVLCNLLENAVKYTPPGSPIEISAEAADQHVTVRVDDHGSGLPAGREDAVFQMFERGRKEIGQLGVGLGLAICRAIVQVHGGAIRGETRPGGARFSFDLPRGVPPAMDELEADRQAGTDA